MIAFASLSSPIIYYILSGNDFRLDLNNPQSPKVICLGSNPQKQYIYGAIFSLMVKRMTKLVNQQGAHPCHLIYDEFSSFYEGSMSYTLANARSNKVAITLGIQDLSQLRKEYGRDHADALSNLSGNLISGRSPATPPTSCRNNSVGPYRKNRPPALTHATRPPARASTWITPCPPARSLPCPRASSSASPPTAPPIPCH